MPWFLTGLLYAGLYVGSALLSALLNKSSQVTSTPGDPQFPTADPEAPVPVVFGTTRVGLNVINKAGITLGENTVRNGALSFGWSATHIGYYYYLDLHAVVCHGPVGAVHEVYVDGTKRLAGETINVPTIVAPNGIEFIVNTVTNSLTGAALPDYTFDRPVSTVYTINAGNILGGKFSRGGVGAGSGDAASSGAMRFFPGTGGVEHNTRLETLHGGPLPPYPHLCHVAFEDNFYFGTSEQLPSIELVVSRAPEQFSTGYLGNNTANAGHEGNPGAILYDILTNTIYGLGFPPSEIDRNSFLVVARACDPFGIGAGAEFEFGLSFVLRERVTGQQVLNDLLRTLDGVLYIDPVTGLLAVRLLRAPNAPYFGYEPTDQIILDESCITKLEYTETAADALVNEVRVEFVDREKDYATNTVTARNVAAIHALGRTESRTVRFLGVQTRELATRLAQRELKALSSVLAHATVTLDRTGYLLTPGQFVTLSWAARGISGKIMRVVSAREMPFGKVEADLVEDIYASPPASFAVEVASDPSPPATQAFIAPWVEPRSEDECGGGVRETLLIYDPQDRVTAIDFSEDDGALWHPGVNNPDPACYVGPYIPTWNVVAAAVVEDQHPRWRVTYTAQDGTTQYLIGEFPQVNGDPLKPTPTIGWTVSGGTVTAVATCFNTLGLYLVFYSDDTAFVVDHQGELLVAGNTKTLTFPFPAAGAVVYLSAFLVNLSGTVLSTIAYETIVGEDGAGAGVGAATTLGQIGIPTVFLTVPENDQWLALSTIPTVEEEVGTEYRKQRYLVGAGSVRLIANIKTLTGTPTVRLKYTTNAFGSTSTLLSWTPGGTGLQSSGFVAVPSGAQADVGLTPYVADGGGTAVLDLYALEMEVLPATASAVRIHTDDHAPEFA